ncbi:MAG: sulfotransferase domain-containing protein [Pseudomonadales bacterium]
MAQRARSMEEFVAVQSKMFRQEDFAHIPTLTLRPTDVVITPFGKSGTTWLQQIVHTLRTRGDMDFDDISRVVPWIETSPGLGLDLQAEQKANPRAFKSHLEYEQLPKGAKYINSVRDPRDAFYSMYKFMEGWFFEPGTISLEEFAEQRYIASGGYWRHLLSWWAVRQEPFVLFMCYELMQQDPEATIRRVANFIDVPLDDELLAITLEHSSIDFMKQHKDRFDDALMRARGENIAGLPPGGESSKVREGRVGDHKRALPESIIDALDQEWTKHIEPKLGFANYPELLAALAAEQE